MAVPVSGGGNSQPTFPDKKTVNPYASLLEKCLEDPSNISAINDVPTLKFFKGQIDDHISQLKETEKAGVLYDKIVLLKENVDIALENKQIHANNQQVKVALDHLEKTHKAGFIPDDLFEKWKSFIQDCNITITEENMSQIISQKSKRLSEIELVLPVAINTLKEERNGGLTVRTKEVTHLLDTLSFSPKEQVFEILLNNCVQNPMLIALIDDLVILKRLEESNHPTLKEPAQEQIQIIKARHLADNENKIDILHQAILEFHFDHWISRDTFERWEKVIETCRIPKDENNLEMIQERADRLDELYYSTYHEITALLQEEQSITPRPDRPADVHEMVENFKITNLEALQDYRDDLKSPLSVQTLIDTSTPDLITDVKKVDFFTLKAIEDEIKVVIAYLEQPEIVKFIPPEFLERWKHILSVDHNPTSLKTNEQLMEGYNKLVQSIYVLAKSLEAMNMEYRLKQYNPNRPQEVQEALKNLDFTKVSALDNYLNASEKSGSFYTESYNPNGALIVDTHNVDEAISSGSYGNVDFYKGLRFTSDKLKMILSSDKLEQRLQALKIVGKSDANVDVYGSTQHEAERLQKLHLQLTPEEQSHVVGFLFADSGKKTTAQFNKTEKLFIETFEQDLNSARQTLSAADKAEVVGEIIKSLKVFLDHQYFLPDIKLKNMLEKSLDNGHFKAVLSDYGDLVDYKEILSNPTPENFKLVVDSLKVWTPEDVNFKEFIEIYRHGEKIWSKIARSTPPHSEELTQEINLFLKDLHQAMTFCVGAAMYRFYTNSSAYPRKMGGDFVGCPSRYRNFATLSVDPNVDLSTNQRASLLKNGCPPDLAEFIIKMMSPKPENRTV